MLDFGVGERARWLKWSLLLLFFTAVVVVTPVAGICGRRAVSAIRRYHTLRIFIRV